MRDGLEHVDSEDVVGAVHLLEPSDIVVDVLLRMHGVRCYESGAAREIEWTAESESWINHVRIVYWGGDWELDIVLETNVSG